MPAPHGAYEIEARRAARSEREGEPEEGGKGKAAARSVVHDGAAVRAARRENEETECSGGKGMRRWGIYRQVGEGSYTKSTNRRNKAKQNRYRRGEMYGGSIHEWRKAKGRKIHTVEVRQVKAQT